MAAVSQYGPCWLPTSKLDELAEHAHRADAESAWPVASLRLAAEVGALGWSIPSALGGQGLDRVRYLEGSEQLASACLTTAFILSQREAAIRWLLQGNEPLRRRYLPGLARGELFATVGLSQLTTSRQHRPPSLRAEAVGGERPSAYRLDGELGSSGRLKVEHAHD